VVNREFGQAHKAEVVAFLKEIDKANASYLSNPAAWTADSAEVKTLASGTGADAAQVPAILEGFGFLPMATQISDTWLGGAAKTIKGTADFLKEAGRIDSVGDDYAGFVNPEFAAEAAK
jgi:taurine transport system substrate-binding protein